jgi:uncharacterized membrane protein YfcA
VHFPVSGVDCPFWLPPAAGFAVSLATSGAGISGAFLLLPFQVSVLGFTGPAVSATNLIFNLVAAPGGIYRYARERRMLWPLALTLIAGTLPGVFLGAVIRVRYLPDVRSFKMFAGGMLLYLGLRLLFAAGTPPAPPGAVVKPAGAFEYTFGGQRYRFSPVAVVAVALLVGLAGGIYGIGGGAIIAPFLVAILRLPVHTVAGATLLCTFATSGAGVLAFGGLGHQPDWALGALFGLGGLFGSYAGARLQKRLPERAIRLGLGVLVTALAVAYLGRL